MEGQTFETDGLRIAVQGCGHGTLNAIYASVEESCKVRGWDSVDLVIIGGDFQATRNAADLSVMSVPVKYRELGDFPAYYNGSKTAPYLTVFTAGNHEASSYLWELYYGGWVAPNIYYLGAANVVRLGPLRIAGMSGIWKGFDYRKTHHERLPFSEGDIKSFYHVREIDVRKLLLLREPVDVGLSHDWPRQIERHGNENGLWRMKPDFKRESLDGTLGNPAAEWVMDRLRPAYWFAAHMHCKFAAVKTYEAPPEGTTAAVVEDHTPQAPAPEAAPEESGNPDEIDLDLDEEDDAAPMPASGSGEVTSAGNTAPNGGATGVPEDLRAQLPASFAKPAARTGPKLNPGQPVPPTITNTTTRFLALDKCLPGRKFLQLCSIAPIESKSSSTDHDNSVKPRYNLQYDPEWLAINRVFHPSLTIGDHSAQTPPDQGEATYAQLIDTERAWVEENIVSSGKLDIPQNFTITAPPHQEGDPESVSHQPEEYTNPQTSTYCQLLGIKNLWDATPEEREERKARGPPMDEHSFGDRSRRGPPRGNRHRGHNGRGGGRGHGRGWRGGGRGRY